MLRLRTFAELEIIENNQMEIPELKYFINETKNSIDGLYNGPILPTKLFITEVTGRPSSNSNLIK